MKMKHSLARMIASALILAAFAMPAGAVSMDKTSSMKDSCEAALGADIVQMAGYLPDVSREKYCDSFPSSGRIILSFDLATSRLRELPIELRIVRAGPGERDDSSSRDIAHVEPRLYPRGALTLEREITEDGAYVALVTAIEPNGERKTARFAFTVGSTLWSYAPVALGAALILGALVVYWRHSPKKIAPSR
ncbi:MAG TPA: hypothetical protein VIG36_04620 [Methylocystis sp.]|jgi:hypothetical protein